MVKSLLITIMEKLESKTIWGAQTLETVPENVPEHCVQTTEIKLQNDVSNLNICFTNTNYNFEAWKIPQCMKVWTDITSDTSILAYVRGYSIEFDELTTPSNVFA